MVLKALALRAATLDELCTYFALRNSLVVEVLVTLARAGWIALDMNSRAFYTTSAGKRALENDELPPFIHIEPRTETIAVERLKGGIASRNEVRFQTTHALVKDPLFTDERQLDTTFLARRLDCGQVDGLLPCEPPRWLRWVDVPACVSETHWVCVNVDVEQGEISGLPERWRRSLGAQLLDFAAKIDGISVPTGRLMQHVGVAAEQSRSHSIVIQPDDLLATPESQAGLLVEALQEAATSVYVASAFFKSTNLGEVTREAILSALRRGVRVGFLWGYEEGAAARDAVRWMEALREEASAAGRNFYFNEIASGSHAKFLFHDPNGQPTFHLGSYNWLSSPPVANSTSPLNITLRLRDGALLAELLRTFAALWLNVPQQHWSPAAAHLQQIASELARGAAVAGFRETTAADCLVRVIRDQEHEAVLFDMLNVARERFFVASHKLGPKARIRLAPLLDPANTPPTCSAINYELSSIDEERLVELKTEAQLRGARLEQRPRMHAKCVVADQRAIVSSFNFLSADPFNNSSNAREVGLLVEGGTVPSELWTKFVEASNV